MYMQSTACFEHRLRGMLEDKNREIFRCEFNSCLLIMSIMEMFSKGTRYYLSPNTRENVVHAMCAHISYKTMLTVIILT